jgi:diguanylate cyclase (GGDEF)-like protein
MTERTRIVLVVDDTPANLAVLLGMLGDEGYEVIAAENAEEALEILEEELPDIILLDVMMPGMDGYTLCRHLKQQQRLAEIPVIFITAKSGTQDVVEGFAAGAVDYVAKPFQRPEVLARVRNHIRLHEALVELERLNKLALDASPLTGLPGNNTIAKAVEDAISSKADVAVIYCDLDNFKAFNDRYGFCAGDDVIQFSARILKESLERQREAADGGSDGFLGHIGGDDFVLILPSSWAEPFGAEVVRRYDTEVVSFYNDEDRARGHIVAKDRQGVLREFPFVGVTMAGVYLRQRSLEHFLQVASVCAEVKKLGKSVQGSVLVFDRREGPFGAPGDPSCKEGA